MDFVDDTKGSTKESGHVQRQMQAQETWSYGPFLCFKMSILKRDHRSTDRDDQLRVQIRKASNDSAPFSIQTFSESQGNLNRNSRIQNKKKTDREHTHTHQ